MTILEWIEQGRALIFDGAMGSLIQSRNLTAADFGGDALDGCNENLVQTRPDVIRDIHAEYFAAGAHVVETNTFGGSPLTLGEYDLADQCYTLNKTAAQIAADVAAEYRTADIPRFAAGSIGPGTKLPTLGHTDFRALASGFREQSRGLLDGGVDLLVIETCQDILQCKAGIVGAQDAMRDCGRSVPIMVSVTIEQMGTMLVGSDIAAALTSLAPYGIDIIGMNCATGPKEMEEHVRYLCQHAPMHVAVVPNAGLPENVGGQAVYHLSPEELLKWHRYFMEKFGTVIAGGCCGTTPEHIRALAEGLADCTPKARDASMPPAVSSVYSSVTLDQEPRPLLIGERSNANGSKKFRELLQAEDWEAIVDMGKDQVAEGAHTLDVCVAYVGRDEVADMDEVMTRYVKQVPLPIVIDSTEVDVLERALERAGGRCIINSINLEDGRERLDTVVRLAKRFGAAVIALTIDEEGMAKTVERKVAIAQRIYQYCVDEHGLAPEDLIFDPLTFTIGSGDQEFYDAGIQTLHGIRDVKAALPGVRTVLGLSNISFGLSPQARVVLNSMYMHEAVDIGLDAAIVHASKILPLNRIPEDAQQLALDLIHNRRAAGDPLMAFMAYFDKNTLAMQDAVVDDSGDPISERLQRRIVDGNKRDLTELLDLALQDYPALQIINTILLEGMKTVGELFGAGKMQLPFVLQSAEAMKAAVAHLEPHMEKLEGQSKGKIVLATVKGDVHDIGKNLVDIILTNNGYTVYNLGIKVSMEQMLQAAEEHGADAIGMSGLLVKSTAIMKDNLEEMRHRGITTPVICGGAALTRRFVVDDLTQSYGQTVFYGKDAFEGLRVMEGLQSGELQVEEAGEGVAPSTADAQQSPIVTGSSDVARDVPIPTPPFWGDKIIESVPLQKLFPMINKTALYKGQWQFRQRDMSKEAYAAQVQDTIEPIFAELTERVVAEDIFQPQVIYGYFPCQSVGNDLLVYRPDSTEEWVRFHFPRQAAGTHKCLADFYRPAESGEMDVVGFHIVTVGQTVTKICQEYYDAGKYTDYLYLHGLAVETAEALAEYWHKVIRVELGIAGQDADRVEDLFHQGYQGSRYSFGYPACPNMEDQRQLFELLKPERIGIELTESFQMDPEASTSAIIAHHPEARYFSI